MTRLEPSRPAWFLLLALVLNLAGCTAEPGIQVAMTPSTAENVVARLPESIGNFRRGVVTILSDGAAGDGPRGQELAYANSRTLVGGCSRQPAIGAQAVSIALPRHLAPSIRSH